ncbi:MAG: cytidine deaminase [Bacteroidales bacterium]|nr:cytidine deaminase [Bacteroidales bacterium]
MMKMDKTLTIKYREAVSIDELDAADRELMMKAVAATDSAYAPYSKFHVGAALLLKDGSTVCGSNQENAAYPSGLCAERTAIFAASAQRPEMRDYEALAIAGRDTDGRLCEASPCGACRQVLLEYERLQRHPLRVLCLLEGGGVRIFESVADLLPFSFEL